METKQKKRKKVKNFTTFTEHIFRVLHAFSFDIILLNISHYLVFKVVCMYTSICTLVVCLLHNCTKNNMDHKEKYLFRGGETMVKFATVTTHHMVFLFYKHIWRMAFPPNVGLMLVHHLRSWPNIKPTVGQLECLFFIPHMCFLSAIETHQQHLISHRFARSCDPYSQVKSNQS